MILTSKIFFRALPVHPEPEIWISGSRSVCRAPKKILLAKIINGLQLLLVKFFDLALPSRGYSTELSQFY